MSWKDRDEGLLAMTTIGDLTSEDYEKTIRNNQRRIEMLEYEAAILRAQKVALHEVLVEALAGRSVGEEGDLKDQLLLEINRGNDLRKVLTEMTSAIKAMAEELDWDYEALLTRAERFKF
jgi:hypothetical protein